MIDGGLLDPSRLAYQSMREIKATLVLAQASMYDFVPCDGLWAMPRW
jgi:hypothetical protein